MPSLTYITSVVVANAPQSGDTYRLYETILFTVTFSEPVRAWGRLRLEVEFDDPDGASGRTVEAVFSRITKSQYPTADTPQISRARHMQFEYKVRVFDRAEDGVRIGANALRVPSGARILNGEVGGDAMLDHAALGPLAGHKVDGWADVPVIEGIEVVSTPRLRSRGGTEKDTYGEGENIRIEVRFDQPVHVEGESSMALEVGDPCLSVCEARYESGSGTDTLVFAYLVLDVDIDSDGIEIPADPIGESIHDLDGFRIRNDADQEAHLSFERKGTQRGHKVDGTLAAGQHFWVEDAEAHEADGEMAFTVRLEPRGLGIVTVDYETRDGSGSKGAVAGLDYTETSGTLRFNPLERERTVTVPIIDDDEEDDGETFKLRLSEPHGALLWPADRAATGTIRNSDPAALSASLPASASASSSHGGAEDRPQVVVAFSQAVAAFAADTPSVSVTGATVASVQPHAEDGLEHAWMFFLVPDGAGAVTFALVADAACAAGGICTPGGRALTEVPAAATIPGPGGPEEGEDRHSHPELTHAHSHFDDGKGYHTEAHAEHTHPHHEHRDTAHPRRPAGHVHHVGEDPDPSRSGSELASHGGVEHTHFCRDAEASCTIDDTFDLHADEHGLPIRVTHAHADSEPDHGFGWSGYFEEAGSGPLLSVMGAEATEGGDGALDFVVRVDREPRSAVTVDYATADGTATAGQDYTATSGTLTFAPGETAKTVQVPVADDTVSDDGETLTLRLSNTSGAGIWSEGGEATGTIHNREAEETAGPPLTASFEDMPGEHDGESAFTFRIAFTEPLSWMNGRRLREDVVAVTGGRATAAGRVDRRRDLWQVTVEPDSGADVTVTLEAGAACGTPAAVCTSDGRALSATVSATVAGPAEETAVAPLTASFEAVPGEHDGESAFRFRVAFSEDIGISYRSLREDAFAVTGGRVTRGKRVDDRRDLFEMTVEPDGAGDVAISLPAGRECSVSGAICTKGENRRQLTNTPSATVAGPAEETAVAPLTASFEGVPETHGGGSAFGFRIAFSEAVAIAPGALRADGLRVSGGSVADIGRVDGRADLFEVSVRPNGGGDVTIVLAGGRECGAAGAVCTQGEPARRLANTVRATVRGLASLSVADARAREGEDPTLDFAVTLDRASSATVTVDYATLDASAKAGEDYEARSGTLRFAPGETAKTVSVPVLDDAHDEGTEHLVFRLDNARGALIADRFGVGRIENTDHMPAAWLARFGRTVTDQVLDAVEARLAASRAAGARVRLAGQVLPFWDDAGERTKAANADADAGASDWTLRSDARDRALRSDAQDRALRGDAGRCGRGSRWRRCGTGWRGPGRTTPARGPGQRSGAPGTASPRAACSRGR